MKDYELLTPKNSTLTEHTSLSVASYQRLITATSKTQANKVLTDYLSTRIKKRFLNAFDPNRTYSSTTIPLQRLLTANQPPTYTFTLSTAFQLSERTQAAPGEIIAPSAFTELLSNISLISPTITYSDSSAYTAIYDQKLMQLVANQTDTENELIKYFIRVE